MNEVVQRIDELRKRKGLTKKQLMTKMGVPPSTFNSWYYADITPSLANIENVCTALEITVEQFFSGMNSKGKGGLQETFLDYWRLMGEKEKSAIEHVIETFKELRQVQK